MKKGWNRAHEETQVVDKSSAKPDTVYSEAYRQAKEKHFSHLKDGQVVNKINKYIAENNKRHREDTKGINHAAFRKQLSRGLRRANAVLIEEALNLPNGSIIDAEKIKNVFVFVRCIDKRDIETCKDDMMCTLADDVNSHVRKHVEGKNASISASLLSGEWDMMFTFQFRFANDITKVTSFCLRHPLCSGTMTCYELRPLELSD